MSNVIKFFADGLRKKVTMTRVGDNVRLEIMPICDAPPPNAPLELVESFAKENARNMANPGIAIIPVEVFSNPKFQQLVAPEKEFAP